MPSDLIYREDAKDYARHAIAKGLNVLEYLDEVPAADSRPVVRGKWIWFGDCSNEGLYCSVCKSKIHKARNPKKKLSNFCPNCGADMREPPKEEP